MSDFEIAGTNGSLGVKLWRGERMCLVGMDVKDPEPDFVGFSIEVKAPGADYVPLQNRLAFDYGAADSKGVTGARIYPSTVAPFQKFRWIHFPWDPKPGAYQYRVTRQHMKADGSLLAGDVVRDLAITLDQETYDDYLDIGFTRNFASSQAYLEKFGGVQTVIPGKADDGLGFKKVNGDVYQWMGFEAYDLIFGLLDQVRNDPSLSIDMLAYDFNEPDILARLEACGKRVRAVIDDSGTHAPATSAESQAAARLLASAGPGAVTRMHFHTLQHNKVLIVRQNGDPIKVLLGSTNFSFRGLYIQANNVLLFHCPKAASLYGKMFELALKGGSGFTGDAIATQWHDATREGFPGAQFCFSPHQDTALSLDPVGKAINEAQSSVFFAIAFLNQIHSGPTHDAINALMGRPIFSCGITDREGGLQVHKPDGSLGIVDFAYLAKNAPEPFKSEWSGGAGINQHNKFVVTDFNTPNAKVFTGSSNLSPSGESGNGDNLVMIQDQRVATSFVLEQLRTFDHLHFRCEMQAKDAPHLMTLAKPPTNAGATWFAPFYAPDGQLAKDRLLFGR